MILRKQRSADFLTSKTSNEWMNGLCWLLAIHGRWFILSANKEVFLCDRKRRLESDSRSHTLLNSEVRDALSGRANTARLCPFSPSSLWKEPSNPPFCFRFNRSSVWVGRVTFWVPGRVLNVFSSVDLELPLLKFQRTSLSDTGYLLDSNRSLWLNYFRL